jgi:hypothetical protein
MSKKYKPTAALNQIFKHIRVKDVFNIWMIDSRETQQIDKKLSNACIQET